MRMKVYEATEGVSVKVCRNGNTERCDTITNPGVELADRNWLTKDVLLPAGTNRVGVPRKLLHSTCARPNGRCQRGNENLFS